MAAISGWKEDPTPGNVGNDIESNNSSEFNAVPSGYRFYPGSFHSIGWECVWWSATEESTENANSNWLRSENSTVFRTHGSKLNANSIRCVSD